jgi:glutamate/tyrosine decarboxylase-like PLP-dependent enzyme
MMWNDSESEIFAQMAGRLAAAFADLPAFSAGLLDRDAVEVLRETAQRLADNYPYFHPLYAGQMLKPPHPVARLAYGLAMLINPNNHALDGGRASSEMERAAVAELAAMFGWQTHLGHLTSGGTMANLEALWIAGALQPGGVVLASEQAHYTHERLSGVLRLPFEPIAADASGKMRMDALEDRLRRGGVGTVVATVGTTGFGAVDPLADIVELRHRYGFRLHADAAYGGYFVLAGNLQAETRRHFDAMGAVDSIVVDPHKHGLQPYGCGSVLFRDPAVGAFYKHDSPYTYFTSDALHLGEISLECSRAGAAAVALWATHRLLPPRPGGEFARGLERCRDAAEALHGRLAGHHRFLPLVQPELDIVAWAVLDADAEEASAAGRRLFEEAGELGLHLALVQAPGSMIAHRWPEGADIPEGPVTCLRSVLMKPEHLDWLDRIWSLLEDLAG